MLWLLLVSLAASGCSSGGKQMERLSDLAPSSASGWTISEDDQTYDRQTIYTFIDGAGEVYLRYAFNSVLVRNFAKSESPPISLLIFDMGDSKDAFGMFSFQREGESIGIGNDSEYSGGLLRFWKDKYLVSISTEEETPKSMETILALGREVADSIEGTGERPDILGLLPPENLAQTTVRYFHEPFGLSYHYPISEENPFNLNRETESLLATYRLDGGAARLVLARYPRNEDAFAAEKKLTAIFAAQAGQAKSRKLSGMRTIGRYVAVVFDAPTDKDAQVLLDGVAARIW
jgi:hypothetical protein